MFHARDTDVEEREEMLRGNQVNSELQKKHVD
jgi:hypothetical protein